MTRAKTILLLAFTIGICLTGCKKEAPDENQCLTIAVIPKGTIHEFWKTVHAGADMAGRELDVDILWKGIKGGKRLKKNQEKRPKNFSEAAATEQPSCEMVQKCCISHMNLVKEISDEN